ncbi:bZIP transcription factor 1 [Phytophthora citrophthora]|uniref:BZIP transcription factor 1 n=1 Tax=Phytophthora citrophthora TaxID=4793 RepID=A0AAD9LC22_9STRA|nr:bZIP transcription factor 1 [Phytophthora citrophthora]
MRKRRNARSPTARNGISPDAKASARRLERCRINQKRYRIRQRAIQECVNETIKEIRGLELRHRDLNIDEKDHRSPCRVVADTFALLEAFFRSPGFKPKSKGEAKDAETREILERLQNSFVSDVECGDIRGVEALMGQLKNYAQYFDAPTLRLEKAEEISPGVVAATASIEVLVSISTLCFIFPQLLQASRVGNDTQPLLGKRLLDKTLVCDCSVHITFDARSGRVARVEASIDWINALLRALGNLEDVAIALHGALVTC